MVEAGDADVEALAEAAAGADTSAGHAGMLNAQELIGILKQKEKALRPGGFLQQCSGV